MVEPSPLDWVLGAAREADERQGADTLVIEVGEILGITGWFVLTTGRNARHVRTIAEAIEQRVVAIGGPRPLQVEGASTAEWMLIDFGDFLVHVFDAPTRTYYELERLYTDAPVVDWRDAAVPAAPQ